MRHHGVTIDEAKTQIAGSPFGILYLKGALNENLREAGERMLRLHTAMQKAFCSPNSLAVSSGRGSGHDTVSEAYVQKALRDIHLFLQAKEAIGRLFRLWELVALHNASVSDDDMVALREGLSRLSRHFNRMD